MKLLWKRTRSASRIAALALWISFGFSAQAVNAQNVKVYVSSKSGDRLTPKDDLQFADTKPEGPTFQINGSMRNQKIDGFGASILEAGLITLNTLPARKQEDVLRSLFDPQQGAGFTVMKTPIGGTDFQSAGPWYTYDDTPGDTELRNFSVERDFGPNGVGTSILRARRCGGFAL